MTLVNGWYSFNNIEFPRDTGSAKIILLNEYEFIVVPEIYQNCWYEHKWQGICKYNTNTQEWTKFIKYSTKEYIRTHSIAINKNTNKLYITGETNVLTIVDLQNMVFDYNKQIDFAPLSWRDAEHTTLVNMDDTIHLIGTTKQKHMIFNEYENKFEQINDFNKNIIKAESIYIPSKQVAVLIGNVWNLHRIWEYNTNEESGFWEYNTNLNEWKVVENCESARESESFECVSATLTKDEQHIIIGIRDQSYIFVLKITSNGEYKLRQSKIKWPQYTCDYQMLCIGGTIRHEMLVFGWIKQLFKTVKFQDLQLPPFYIINEIVLCYNQEEIHWIGTEDFTLNKHFVINMKTVLSTVTF